MFRSFLGLPLVALFFACSSSPPVVDHEHPPAWATGPTRTFDGGYIVYVGSGEDRDLGRSHFKAEAMALQDLANECSMAPRGARVEDHYDQDVGVLHRSYAKVAVEFQVCENAKNAVTPEAIRTLANVQMTDEVKQYQATYDEPEPDNEETEAPALASSAGGTPSAPSGQDSGAYHGPGGAGVVFIGSAPEYYVVSQQVAYVKQTVILAPASQYPPQSAVATQPVAEIAPAQAAINRYAAANPALRSSSEAFSTARPNASAHQAAALREPTAQRNSAREQGSSEGRGSGQRGSSRSGKTQGHVKKKRRRH
jgi:hypothetical protein